MNPSNKDFSNNLLFLYVYHLTFIDHQCMIKLQTALESCKPFSIAEELYL